METKRKHHNDVNGNKLDMNGNHNNVNRNDGLMPMGDVDLQGTCWTQREFSHPERTVRIATAFSGIGAPEHALERLGLKHQCVFACDIGERYLFFPYKCLAELAQDLKTDEERKLFAQTLYDANKARTDDHFRKGKREKPLSVEDIYQGVFCGLGSSKEKLAECERRVKLASTLPNRSKLCKLELGAESIRLLTRGMTQNERETWVNQLYDTVGVNLVKSSFLANHDLVEEHWHNDIRFMDAAGYKGKVDLFVGGSPCQSYSQIGKRLGLEDTRGTLFHDFAEIIRQCEPKVFIYENVKGMVTPSKGKVRALEVVLNSFEDLGYDLHWRILDAKDYGVPQHRERVWVVGFRNKTDFLFPRPIPLEKRLYDYLDPELPPRNGNVTEPYTRDLTGMECLRLMGFENFQVSKEIQQMSGKGRERELCAQAGNSMVVECLMALYRQMDITQYGI